MKKDIFKALIISVLTLSLIFTLLACVGKDNFTPSGTLPDTSGQNQGNGENDPHKPSTPGTTDKPTDPATPDVPVTPSDPSDPGDPIVPVTPSDPEEPGASDIPDTPSEPSAAVEQKPAQKTLDILDSTTKQDFENIIKGGLASTLVSLADGTVWGVDEDNNEGFTLRSSKPAIKLSVSPGAAIVFSGNDTYKGLSNVVDAYSEQRAMGGWILQGNGDLWVWDRDGVTVYDPVKIAENIAQYFQDQKVAITKTGELVYINYQVQEGKLDSLEITKLIDNVKTYSQGLGIDNNNMVWRINGGKAAKMLSHGKTIANENYVITQHNELWYIPYSGYPRMISENTSEYYGGEHNVILTTKGALTYTAEEKTQLIAENVARVFASSTFIDKTGRLYRYDFKSKEKTLIDINVVHYESGYYIRSDATLWKICYEDDELCSKQILDNVLMPGQTPVQPENPATPSEPSAAIDRYPDWNADDYQGVLKAMESRNPQFLTTAADGKVYGIWETWKGSYYEWTANFLEDYYTPLKFLDGAQLDINGDLYATNTMDAQYTKLFADVIDAAAEGDKGWALLSKGELWHWNAVVEDEKVAYKTSLIKTNVAKASAYSYTDLSGDSFSYTIEYGQDGTPYLANEKKLNKAQEDLSPEKPILQSCKYVFESIGETTFSYIDLEHNLYIVKDGIHKLLAEDVVYAAVWGEVCAFVKADGTLWIDNQKILDNVLLTDFTVNAASFREEMTALKQSKALLHGPHTVLIKGLSIPVILEVQDGGYVMAISARGQRIEFKVSNRKSLTDVFEVKDILVLSDGKAVGGYYIAIYPDGYTEIKNTNHVDDVSYSLYQEDGKLRYRCIVNRLSESRTFDSVAIIFDKDEVYSQEGTAIIENGKIEFLAPEKTIKACDKINVQRQFERNRKTEDTTIEQWYEENKIIYDRYFDKENERYVDEEKTASFLNNDKEIVGAGSFIGPYRQRLFYYEIDQKNRTFDVCYVSVNSEGKPDNICYATLSIPDEIEYDSIRYAFFGGSGGSNETGVTFSVKNGNEEYYMNIYIAAIKDEVYICDIYIGDDSAY